MLKKKSVLFFVESFWVQPTLQTGYTCFTSFDSHEVDSIIVTILKNVIPREIAEHDIAPAASGWLSQVLKLDFDQTICPFQQYGWVSEPVE